MYSAWFHGGADELNKKFAKIEALDVIEFVLWQNQAESINFIFISTWIKKMSSLKSYKGFSKKTLMKL